jgi:hypothetical protein
MNNRPVLVTKSGTMTDHRQQTNVKVNKKPTVVKPSGSRRAYTSTVQQHLMQQTDKPSRYSRETENLLPRHGS